MKKSNNQSLDIISHLLKGNSRWIQGKSKYDFNTLKETTKQLIDHQTPHTIILTCSDSRLVPEIIFDSNIGELFSIRIAGNIISKEIISTIEFACLELSIRQIIILGHEKCGAIAIKYLPYSLKHNYFEPILSKIEMMIPGDNNLSDREKILDNAKNQKEELVKLSRIVRELVDENKLKIDYGIYELNNFKVEIILD